MEKNSLYCVFFKHWNLETLVWHEKLELRRIGHFLDEQKTSEVRNP